MDEAKVEEISVIAQNHARRPRNYGPIKGFNGHNCWTGPCGDTMEYWLRIELGVLVDLGFRTDGCDTSVACGSMTGVMALGESLELVRQMKPEIVLEALNGLPEEFEHCALLAVKTLQQTCDDYLAEKA